MTNYSDRWEEDENGNKFVFTIEMQRRLDAAGLPLEPGYLKELGAEPEPQSRPRERSRERDEQPAEAPHAIQIDPATGKYLGKLKWFNEVKGYGFISRGDGEDIFFHKSALTISANDLSEGQWILYDVEEKMKGPEATEIEPYDGDVN